MSSGRPLEGGWGMQRPTADTGVHCHRLRGRDPSPPRCHLDFKEMEEGLEEESERQGDKSPPEHGRHDRVRSGLLTPGVCKSELPVAQA